MPAATRTAEGTATAAAGTRQALLSDVLTGGGLRPVYQPIVDLATGAPVGYEALIRGPRGSELENPAALFGTARRAGRLGDLDRACQAAALDGARAAGLAAPWALFVNVEPETAEAPPPGGRTGNLPVVLELTERALTSRPAQLLRLVACARAQGWRIALDDVGADRDSLALLPLLRPDVIKLDLRLVQARPTADIAAIMNAVNAEAERSGSLLLAEGIETPAHLMVARALGATLGQGWLFGRPAALPAPLPGAPDRALRLGGGAEPDPGRSPYDHVATARPPRIARKPLLIEVSKHLERQAAAAGESAVVAATFQHAGFFTPATRRRYTDLVGRAAFVGALGAGMAAEPLPGVRGGPIDPADPLVGEWDVVVVGAHFAAALVARDLGDGGPDDDRRFAFVLTHDRGLAIAVARSLLARIPRCSAGARRSRRRRPGGSAGTARGAGGASGAPPRPPAPGGRRAGAPGRRCPRRRPRRRRARRGTRPGPPPP